MNVGARVVASLCAAALWACLATSCRDDGRVSLEHALVGRGRIVLSDAPDLASSTFDGTTLSPLAGKVLAAASRDAAPLVEALERERWDGIYVGPNAKNRHGVLSRMASYARVPGLVGAHLSPLGALYLLDPTRNYGERLREALAHVARRLVGGEQPPRITSFPSALRQVQPIEVMVMLRSDVHPRLWRSARGSSFARALLTASEVARRRWIEREQTMGGPINTLLPKLYVEVALLQDDGEIGVRDPAFIDRVVTSEHGVAYERKGAWRYYLPEATHRGGRKPSEAYAALFRDDGLPEDSLDNRELRLYRIAVLPIGVSPPSATRVRDEVSGVASPDEVLAPPK